MDKEIFEHKRKSYMDIGKIYFWTGTINIYWQGFIIMGEKDFSFIKDLRDEF
jgi:hypothetical protein